jgi:hypothetical protein
VEHGRRSVSLVLAEIQSSRASTVGPNSSQPANKISCWTCVGCLLKPCDLVAHGTQECGAMPNLVDCAQRCAFSLKGLPCCSHHVSLCRICDSPIQGASDASPHIFHVLDEAYKVNPKAPLGARRPIRIIHIGGGIAQCFRDPC